MYSLATLFTLATLATLAAATGSTEWHNFIAQAPVRIIGIASTLTVLLQIIKRFFPALGGWWAVAINVILATTGVLILTDPSLFYTVNTAAHVLEAALAAAGIHGTVKALSNPAPDAPATPVENIARPAPYTPNPGDQIAMKSTTSPSAGIAAKTVLLLVLSALALVGATGCNSWERTVFQTLTASKAVVDTAQADYVAGKIKQTTLSYKAINDLKAAQTMVVEAFLSYESVKLAGGSGQAQQDAQAKVDTAIAQIPALIAAVKSLYTTIASPVVFEMPAPRSQLRLAA